MTRRGNSFARALKDAQDRMAKAKAERVAAQTRLLSLDMEIPKLERTVAALYSQVHPTDAPLEILKADPDRVVYRNSKTGQETPPQNMSPEELAKWYTERDLSGVGSVVPERPATPAPQSEDEMLPDDFAVGKKE